MTNTQQTRINENGAQLETQMTPLRCCCSVILILIGAATCLTGFILMFGEGLFVPGPVPIVLGASMLLFGIVVCCKKQNKPTTIPVYRETAHVNQEHPYFEHLERTDPSVAMETNLHLSNTVYQDNQPSVSAPLDSRTGYQVEVDPNCPPPRFSVSSAYPLKATSHSLEPAPPSYEEAMNK
uniref:Protein LCHN-like n=1 Tax=Phallusia mammillata TaxID=59560 RepID=A0A6F9DGD8_9ASCI|nr:protein LCHN-like [Phallusia mammillata]